MIKRSNLKLYTLIVFSILNIMLFFLIQIDGLLSSDTFFLKPNSPYYTHFQNTFKNQKILNFWERDVTQDNKPEFLFVTQPADCTNCKETLSIYQAEKKVFEKEIGQVNIVFGNGIFTIEPKDDDKESEIYSWNENKFVPMKIIE